MNWLIKNEVFELFSEDMKKIFISNGMVSEKYVFELFKKIRFEICGCPRCGTGFYSLEDGRYICKDMSCRCHFSIISETYLDSTKIPLHKWWRIIWWMADMRLDKRSAMVARDCEISQKSAWYAMSLIRSSIGMVNSFPENKDKIFKQLLTPHIKEKFPELIETRQHLITLNKLIYLKEHGTTN